MPVLNIRWGQGGGLYERGESMDGWAIGIIIVSVILYFVSKKKPFFVLTTGIGIGMLIAAIWFAVIISQAFS